MAKAIRRTRGPKRRIPRGVIHIQSGFSNTLVTATDPSGGVVAWSSSGACGFRGAKRGTPFAAQMAAQGVAKQCTDMGMRQVEVVVRGPGAGRDTALRTLQANGLAICLLRDTTPLPHNGCRPPKRRRV